MCPVNTTEWDHEKRARTKGGKVYVEIHHDGSTAFHKGFVTNAEARKLDKQSTGKGEEAKPEVRPEMSGPMAEYVSLHRHNAARAHLLKSPGVAFRLFVAHAICSPGNWDVRSHNVTSRKETTEDSITNSIAETEMTEAQASIAELLASVGVNISKTKQDRTSSTVESFCGLLRLDDEAVMKIAAYVMADTLDHGGAIVEAVAALTSLDMSKYWKPEPAFFALLRDKRPINAMLGELASPATAKAMLTDTAKAQRTAIGNRISGEGCEPNPDWMPRWMATPPSSYVKGAPCHTADRWKSIKPLVDALAKSTEPDRKVA